VLILLDNLAEQWAQYYDTVALLLVCIIALYRRYTLITLIVLGDYTITYFGQNWLRSLELWGSLGIDYHYILGIKDSIMALTLFLLAASPWLSLAYLIPALLCWGLWWARLISEESITINIPLFELSIVDWVFITRDQWLAMYYAWSPLYALTMVLQIFGVSRGDSDAGKRVRRGFIHFNRSRVPYLINHIAIACTANPFRQKTRVR